MAPMKAHVIDGKIVVDEPVEMPEGTELYVVQVPLEDEMTDEDRAELNAMLEESFQELAEGKWEWFHC